MDQSGKESIPPEENPHGTQLMNPFDDLKQFIANANAETENNLKKEMTKMQNALRLEMDQKNAKIMEEVARLEILVNTNARNINIMRNKPQVLSQDTPPTPAPIIPIPTPEPNVPSSATEIEPGRSFNYSHAISSQPGPSRPPQKSGRASPAPYSGRAPLAPAIPSRPREKNKPKYASLQHEKESKFFTARHKLGMRVNERDFTEFIPVDTTKMHTSHIFKWPAYKPDRIQGCLHKLSTHTGIPEHEMGLVDMFVSTKNPDSPVAIMTFDNEEIVEYIFKRANEQMSDNLNIFPILPIEVTERKKDIQTIIDSMRSHDSSIRYQLRNGIDDIRIFMKHYHEREYEQYQETPLELLDPNDDVRPFKPELSYPSKPKENNELQTIEEDEEGFQKDKKNKRKHTPSPVQRKKRREVSPRKLVNCLDQWLNGSSVKFGNRFAHDLSDEEDIEADVLKAAAEAEARAASQ